MPSQVACSALLIAKLVVKARPERYALMCTISLQALIGYIDRHGARSGFASTGTVHVLDLHFRHSSAYCARMRPAETRTHIYIYMHAYIHGLPGSPHNAFRERGLGLINALLAKAPLVEREVSLSHFLSLSLSLSLYIYIYIYIFLSVCVAAFETISELAWLSVVWPRACLVILRKMPRCSAP
jgi:hypothetical protein